MKPTTVQNCKFTSSFSLSRKHCSQPLSVIPPLSLSHLEISLFHVSPLLRISLSFPLPHTCPFLSFSLPSPQSFSSSSSSQFLSLLYTVYQYLSFSTQNPQKILFLFHPLSLLLFVSLCISSCQPIPLCIAVPIIKIIRDHSIFLSPCPSVCLLVYVY